MKNVFILSGASGSGKSFYAEKMINGCHSQSEKVSAVVVSAEDHRCPDSEVLSDFNLLKKMQRQCFRQFMFSMQAGFDLIFVDNANTTAIEIAPYVMASDFFGYEHNIITFQCRGIEDVRVAAARSGRGLSFDEVFLQHNRICDRRLLPTWNFVDVSIEYNTSDV